MISPVWKIEFSLVNHWMLSDVTYCEVNGPRCHCMANVKRLTINNFIRLFHVWATIWIFAWEPFWEGQPWKPLIYRKLVHILRIVKRGSWDPLLVAILTLANRRAGEPRSLTTDRSRRDQGVSLPYANPMGLPWGVRLSEDSLIYCSIPEKDKGFPSSIPLYSGKSIRIIFII